jgi:hypothetical protein
LTLSTSLFLLLFILHNITHTYTQDTHSLLSSPITHCGYFYFFSFFFSNFFSFQLQEQATEKRKLLEDTCIRGETELKAAHHLEVEKMKNKLERHIQTMLRSAAADEGFDLGKER